MLMYLYMSRVLSRSARGWGAAALAALAMLSAGTAARAEVRSWDEIRQSGYLSFAVYQDNAPFSDGSNDQPRGVDVELARKLAAQLGLQARFIVFHASMDSDGSINDDLRNMVWKGHYLGYGPGDVLLHVPVDPPLMKANPQVEIFAPYWHERLVIARDIQRLPHLETLAQLGDQRVAAAGQTLAGWLMLGADSGAYRNQLLTDLKDGVQAAQALRQGQVAAAVGLASELESVLAGDPRYVITRLPTVRAPREGWAVGLAVRKASMTLAHALQKAVDDATADGRVAKIFAQAHVSWQAV
ncbi:MAG: transporter substrate-binding domain-containing protein [Betaproteobacteria bacterium]|nr:transporter substrate-binding domain-containing protein [Betaproteobacteria bacterium]